MPARQKLLFAGASLRMPLFWMGLRLFGFSRMVRWTKVSTSDEDLPITSIREIADTVNIASHVTMGSENCLVRSLVLRRALSRRGVQTELKIGVRTANGHLEAHAWLERNGIPVNDRDDIGERFAAFDDPLSVAAFGP